MNPVSAPTDHPPRWLTLGQASRFLGVDASTLRVWTDSGRIRAFRTPGGHRRYAHDELLAFLQRSRQDRTPRLAEMIGPHGARLVQGTSRRKIRQQQWYAALDRRTSEAMRQTCRALMDALAGYLAGGRRQRAYRREGERAGHELGREVASMRLTPATATQAFLFFKEMITNTVSTKLPLSPDRKVRSIRRIDLFLNQVLLQVMDAYERERQLRDRG